MNQITRLLLCLCCFSAMSAHGFNIDFEDLTAGDVVSDQYLQSHGVWVRAVNRARGTRNVGTVLDTTDESIVDFDLVFPENGNGPWHPGNVMVIHNNASTCNSAIANQRTRCENPNDEGAQPAGYFEFYFPEAVTVESVDFFDIELGENGATETNAIQFYSGTLAQLLSGTATELAPDTFYTPNTGGDNTGQTLQMGVAGVNYMRINMTGSGAIDNIRVVPLPAAVWMFMSALLGLASVNRARGKA